MSSPALEPLGVLARAQDSFGIPPNAPANEWPFNLLSQRAVRFAGGRIGRPGDSPLSPADPAEQALCDAISEKATALVNKIAVRPADAVFEPFRLPVLPGEPVPSGVTADLIRERFGGTLHPWAKVELTPLADARSYDLSGLFFGVYPHNPTAHNAPWKAVWDWFKTNRELTGGGWAVSVEGGVTGTQAVRLLVGLTAAGSVVGVATVGPVSGLTRTMTPAEMYPQLVEFERSEFVQWLDPAGGRAVARVILRTFPPEVVASSDEGAWAGRTRAAAAGVRSRSRPAFWRSRFHQLTPERAVVLPAAWEGVQRCGTGGRWNAHWDGGPQLYADLWKRFGEFERGGDGFHLFDPDAVRRCADWLATRDENWLKGRYADLRATDYAPFVSEADFAAVAAVFLRTKEFYTHAAALGLAVVTEVTARTDEQIAAETAHPLPAARPTPPGACPADEMLLAPLMACLETHSCGDGDGETEWPHNDLSPRIVRFTCGRIAREGEDIPHRHAEGEVDRCRVLSAEAERLLAGCVPDHDQGGPYLAFYAAANRGDDVPVTFTDEFVRDVLFNGTVNPECGVSVGPLTAGAVWGEGSAEAEAFVGWFTSQPGLHGHAFVSIGLSEDEGGACHPRLAVAFTEKGSVVGVCGYVVWA